MNFRKNNGTRGRVYNVRLKNSGMVLNYYCFANKRTKPKPVVRYPVKIPSGPKAIARLRRLRPIKQKNVLEPLLEAIK